MNADQKSAPGAKVSWWLALLLFLAYVLLPGPDRTPFSGTPMATKTQIVFFAVLGLATFCWFFHPRRRTRPVWLAILAIAIAVKVVLAPMVIEPGWKGRYWWVQTWSNDENDLRLQRFYQHHSERWYRLDRDLRFKGATFGLPFVNNHPAFPWSSTKLPRDIQYPIRVEWTGFVQSAGPRQVAVTGAGEVAIDVDGRRVFAATSPEETQVDLPLVAGRTQKLRVTYVKPPAVEPTLSVEGLDGVLPSDRFGELSRSNLARGAIVVVGILAALTLGLAFVDAYRPLSRLLLEDIWDRQSKVWAIAFVALFLFIGFGRNVQSRHVSAPQYLGDDFLTYESQSRMILYDGLLMVDEKGEGKAYFHYPLYPYGLALAHFLLGEDWGTVVMFNSICVASVFVLVWRMLRGRVAEGALIAVLAVMAFVIWRYWMPYTHTAYSDHLYLPVVFGTLLLFIGTLERPRITRFALVGVLTALGAATRPSFLIFVPFALLAILLEKRIGSLWLRVRSAIGYGLGFGAGVSPFTLRNWVVAGKFVLLVASFQMIPMFMYGPEERAPSTALTDARGEPLGATGSLKSVLQILAERPLKVAWVEIRKIGFTFGLTFLGPKDVTFPAIFVVFPIAFAFALKTRRVPWAFRTVILAFTASHVVAVVIATPWTYGYKTIVPMHLVFLVGIAFLLPKWGTRTVVDLPVRRPAVSGARPRVSVVLPTYNEKDSIREVIQDFVATGVADEVIVINNNAAAGTSEEVAGTGAIEIFETEQGYGAACQRGLREASGDFIVLCEPDGTFDADDIHKLLAYAKDFDVVFGSRTSQQFVWRGANMGLFLRLGNWAVAKYMELLFNGPNLTDVGCTMRLVTREAARKIEPHYRIKGSHFGPEMMALVLRHHEYRAVQVPVNYKPRVGKSSVTGDPATAFWLGLQMIWLITRHGLAAAAEQSPLPSREPARDASPG